VGPAAATHAQGPASDRSFVQGGVAVVMVFEQPAFGGYFCCDAGGASPGVFVEAGRVLSSRLTLRGELAVPGRETDNLSAPRFIQENQHRDVTLSALVGFQPTDRGRVRPTLLGGLGVAASRTTRASRLLWFTPTGPVPDDTPNIIPANERRLALTVGADVPIDLTERVGLVVTARGRWIARSDESRFQDGLGRWLLTSGLGLQLRF
jgi:hypothetical protein